MEASEKPLNSATWCPLPWMSQSIRNNGELRVCCHANQGADRGIIRDQDGTPFSAGSHDLIEARNSTLMKEVRAAILKGEWHPTCHRCQSEEAAGIRSRRIYENELWNAETSPKESLAQTKSDGFIETKNFPVKFLDVRFGNLCNLKCRSCGPTDSSKWYRDYHTVWGPSFYESSRTMVISDEGGRHTVNPNPYGWYENAAFWEQLEQNIEGISKLYLVGGEPLLIDAHYKFLQKCVEKGRAKDILLEYNSNISVIPAKALELWKHFKLVKIGASIDGVGAVNDYIRHPSKWEEIVEHLHLLDRAEGNLTITVSTTVMIYNILDLPKIILWKLAQNFRRVNSDAERPLISPHPLHRPRHLCIQTLPGFAKKYVREFYDSKKDEISQAILDTTVIGDKDKAIRNANGILSHYANFMDQADYSTELSRFWWFTRSLDKIRGESIEQSLPELYALIGETES